MPLIECAECGRQISDKAPTCPGCGAPPETFLPAVIDTASIVAESQPKEESDAIDSASTADGRHLWYFPSVKAFVFGEDQLALEQVRALDGQGALQWTRLDVRHQMLRAAKRGTPMDELPTDSGPGVIEKFANASEKLATTLGPPPGSGDVAMVCPHCQSRGTVKTKSVKQKKGISGGKATAALLTGGVSLLATGLSRKEKLTQARCTKCGASLEF